MTGGYTRGIGVLILLGCTWWGLNALTDVASVSPVHWGLLLPHLAVLGFPAVVGTVTAGAMLIGKSGVRALLLGLVVSVVQAVAISYAAPDIEERYSEAVQLGKALERDSALGLKRTP
jgi:hypothetical protein